MKATFSCEIINASLPRDRWQSGMRSCIMPGLPTHLVQELDVGTVHWRSVSWMFNLKTLKTIWQIIFLLVESRKFYGLLYKGAHKNPAVSVVALLDALDVKLDGT